MLSDAEESQEEDTTSDDEDILKENPVKKIKQNQQVIKFRWHLKILELLENPVERLKSSQVEHT